MTGLLTDEIQPTNITTSGVTYVAFAPEQWAALEARFVAAEERAEKAEKERDAWRRAAQDQTPGGSEFTTPAECIAYVRRLRAGHIETVRRFKDKSDAAIAERNTARAEVARAREGARHIAALHVAYEAFPTDRGGRSGPKGKAYAAFIAARDAALATPSPEPGDRT